MKNVQAKKATMDALDLMIFHADKGPSGFWTDDYEGCGNPAIFPKFKAGLTCGKLVQKEHYLCPWNTAVLYGAGHGNIHTGCYYSCSISRAKYLKEQELKDILTRFKRRLAHGDYDNTDHLLPLLTKSEHELIEKRIRAEEIEQEQRAARKQQERHKKAAALIAKYPSEESLLSQYYGETDCVDTEYGIIFFDPGSRKDVVGAEKMSYDQYLDVQLASLQRPHRSSFANGIFNYLLEYKGQLEKVGAKYVCFKRIFISGMYPDGEMFDDKEDHVWMQKTGFEELMVGDSVSFCAEVYRYIKTGNGKQIDYGLRNPTGIRKIEDYELPSDDELLKQSIREILCETCYLHEYCNRIICMRNMI